MGKIYKKRKCSNLLGLTLLVSFLFAGSYAHAQGFVENFDNIINLASNDWHVINHSQTIGISSWSQGNTIFYSFDAYNGDPESYIAADYNSSTGHNAISDWLIAPNRIFNNGDTIRFFTRRPTGIGFPDRMQVRFSSNGASLDVGATYLDTGDFTTLLLDINPNLVDGGYPESWTEETLILSGLPGPTSGRFAFRYFIPVDGGPNGSNSKRVGIDSVVYAPVGANTPICFSMSGCHADSTIYANFLSCNTVVNFTPPTGTYSCAAPAGQPDTFFFTGQIDTFTVPAGWDSVRIAAWGAEGGFQPAAAALTGRGAAMVGDFILSPGSQMKILVGEQPSLTHGNGNGGGGGTFVTDLSNNPLVVAGGGGGSSEDNNDERGGQIGTSGGSGSTYGGVGGIAGNGGGAGPNGTQAGAGGGLLTDGADGSDPGGGGKAFINGGAGSALANPGGFGGGGHGQHTIFYTGGAGGGYSGGGSGSVASGGGGGSYNSGNNQSNLGGVNSGHGMVIMTPLNTPPVITSTLITGLPPGSSFPVGTTTETYRIDDGVGDTAYCTFNITILDTATPTISCPNNITTCTNVVTGLAPNVSGWNACSMVSYTLTGATSGSGANDASGTAFNVGTTNVKYVVTNANGNADSCNFNVTIDPPTGLLAGTTISPESESQKIINPVDVRYTDCDLIATLAPSGVNPVSGYTDFKVTIDNTPQTYNGQPYVKRHYDIEPAINAATSTATITLYAYQYEFDNYNNVAVPMGLPPLPSGGVDNGNVRITQFHGVGTAPGNYPGPEELITPTVSWNATYNYWEMTFPVTGFSGFYIHTAYGHPLAIGISDISAVNKGTKNRVDWKTATEDRGDMMTLERSADGANFNRIADIATHGKASDYTYWDETPVQGVNYYRVKVTAASGDISYTKIVTATVKAATGQLAITAVPNPVKDKVTVSIYGSSSQSGTVEVMDPTGKRLLQYTTENNSAVIDMSGLPSGIYFIRYTDNTGSVSTRIDKQ
jgi:hypothetical protein